MLLFAKVIFFLTNGLALSVCPLYPIYFYGRPKCPLLREKTFEAELLCTFFAETAKFNMYVRPKVLRIEIKWLAQNRQ